MTISAVITSPPDRSRAQRLDALVQANHVRVFRARLKRDISAGRVSAPGLLLTPPAELETCKVLDLLLAVPKIGRVKANNLLRRHDVSPSKTVGGLSPRQRAALVDALLGFGGARR